MCTRLCSVYFLQLARPLVNNYLSDRLEAKTAKVIADALLIVSQVSTADGRRIHVSVHTNGPRCRRIESQGVTSGQPITHRPKASLPLVPVDVYQCVVHCQSTDQRPV
jgi:hypothetical protein